METINATVVNESLAVVQRFLPSNYQAQETPVGTLVFGTDQLGWTFQDYVLPRLASGLIFQVAGLQTSVAQIEGLSFATISISDLDDLFGPPVFETTVEA